MSVLNTVLTDAEAIEAAILKRFGGTAAASVAATAGAEAASSTALRVANVTAGGVNALVQVFGPLVDIVRGKGTLTEDLQAINALADVVAIVCPTTAPEIALAEAAEPAAVFLLQMVRTMTAHDVKPLTPPRAAPPTTAAEPFSPTWGHDPRASDPSGAVPAGWTPPDP